MPDEKCAPQRAAADAAIKAFRKRPMGTSRDETDCLWEEMWEAVDFSWEGLADAGWARGDKANEAQKLKRWRAPASFPGGGRTHGEGACTWKEASLQDYWRWSLGARGFEDKPPEEQVLLDDATLSAAGLLLEREGRVFHALHCADITVILPSSHECVRSSTTTKESSGQRPARADLDESCLTATAPSPLSHLPQGESGTPISADGGVGTGRALGAALMARLAAADGWHGEDAADGRAQLAGARAAGLDATWRAFATTRGRVHVAIQFASLVDLDASQVTFGDETDFGATNFPGEALFLETIFKGRAVFGSASFGGRARFDGVTIRGGADFWAATFWSEATFVRATFDGAVEFGRAIFGGQAVFDHAGFLGVAVFRAATFENAADFRVSTFFFWADFVTSRFEGEARFHAVTFNAHAKADFQSTTFGGDAQFTQCRFDGVAIFDRIVFKRLALFGDRKEGGSTFAGRLSFRAAVFEDYADFSTVTWPERPEDQHAAFEGARFRDVADFQTPRLAAYPLFHGAVFERRLLLLDPVKPDTVGPDRPAAMHVLSFLMRLVWSLLFAWNVGLVWHLIRRRNEPDGETPDGLFAATVRATEKTVVRDVELRRAQDYDPERDELASERGQEARWRVLAGGLRTLKLAMHDQSDPDREQRFYRYELAARRRQPSTPFWERATALVYRHTSDYGASIARPFVALFWVFLLFGGVFYGFAAALRILGDPITAFWEAAEFSWNNIFRPLSALSAEAVARDGETTLTSRLLYGHGAGWGLLARALATIESLFALVLAFLFALAVRRRFQIT